MTPTRGLRSRNSTPPRFVYFDATVSIIKTLYHVLKDRTMFQVNSVWLPGHCQVQGIINERIGTDGFQYGDMFEVRLPTPADWNGRFMFQGGGGTEGSVPPATGSRDAFSDACAWLGGREPRRRA